MPPPQELELLDDTNTIFKLLGPVLVRQDMEDARVTVAKRLQYITGEMWVPQRPLLLRGGGINTLNTVPFPPPFPSRCSKRYEQQMQEMEKRSEQQRELLARLQHDFQRAQGKA